MALPAPSPDLGLQPGDLGCAFRSVSGNWLDDVVVDFVSKALRMGDNSIHFASELP